MNKQPIKRTRVNGKDSYTHCIECKLEFDTIDDRGRKVIWGGSGCCKRCYMRAYSNRGDKTCLKCQRTLYNTTKSVCKICRELEREAYYKENPKARKTTSYQQKLKILNTELDYEKFELIRRLLSRFKSNYQTYVDYFRLLDVYIDIYDHETHLDSYPEFDQVEIILRRLKDIWLHNKEVKKQKEIIERAKIISKRKRLLKD